MKPVESKQGGSGSSRYTLFTISDQYFALEISFIKEVLDFPGITRLPNKETYFTGAFNLRGKIVTIIDLRLLMNLEIPENKNPKMVILAEYNGILVGIAVDQVMDFLNIEEIKIQLPLKKAPPAIANYVMGFLEKTNFGHIYLLDIIKLIRTLRS